MNERTLNISSSLLDVMKDGCEFESLLGYHYNELNIVSEIRRSISEIEAIRQNPIICYVANVVNRNINNSIDGTDDLPFNEMVASISNEEKEIDVVLVTPGGLATQVNNFVNTLRPRFEKVNFILLNMAMSAGTIFIMSGDEIIMSNQSKFGPIDPQIPNREGRFVPAQSLLIALDDIKKRGERNIKENRQPDWTDIQLLRNIDPRDLGLANSASKYSIGIVKDFLVKYKFKSWTTHSSTGQSVSVSEEEKDKRANKIANLLCNHSVWKSHGHAINRDVAKDVCKLEILNSESISGLDRAMRRMWAMFYWLFENTGMVKIFISENYCIIRNSAPHNIPLKKQR
ncbi:MAG: hypothetical protein R3Y59_01270 [bacterium]